MPNSINAEKFAQTIMEQLHVYEEQVTKDLKKEVMAVAKECKNDIVAAAPKKTGAYKKGWTLKKAYEDKNDIRVVIHNPKRYRLTHLLEYGHAKVNGGRVEGKPHIGPAEKKAEQKLIKKVKVIIRNGKA